MRIPSTHEGLWQMFLSRTGIFWGATWDVTVSWTDSRRHCESARGSVRTCSILDLLSEEFLISHCAHLCLGETESARWDISPSMLFILRVPRSPCHSVSHPASFFFLCWFLASLRQMASTQVSHQQSPLIWITSLSQWGRKLEPTGCVMTQGAAASLSNKDTQLSSSCFSRSLDRISLRNKCHREQFMFAHTRAHKIRSHLKTQRNDKKKSWNKHRLKHNGQSNPGQLFPLFMLS